MDYFDPHEPWDPPEPYWSMYRDPNYSGQDLIDPVPGPVEGYLTPEEVERVKSLYAGEVTFVDKWIGVLLEAISSLGLDENTLIMHLSDHGEPFGEHGIIRKARPWAYWELVEIPWIVRLPGGEHGGQRIDAIVQPRDLMPTVLDALGIREPLVLPYRAPRPTRELFPQDVVVDQRRITLHGRNLLPLIRGEESSLHEFALFWPLRPAVGDPKQPLDAAGERSGRSWPARGPVRIVPPRDRPTRGGESGRGAHRSGRRVGVGVTALDPRSSVKLSTEPDDRTFLLGETPWPNGITISS
ncbi:MAG: hypothetical protein KatS3mg115_2527 [Candidatus Poribacteria bacterium]|nr:MAG: hypothetical protein KatS3mg115_2527 [Candidatus Poribacteria bacterium]